ncbi:MAG: endonuclease/exonuclease/phosphatase family protein [Flavobacterium sp.]|nr:endonuclease/exonuclease/phosphatase family protein [Flavobacterium sp.]
MKISISFYFLFFMAVLNAQVKVLSWNLENFGKSKSDDEIKYIAIKLKTYDIVAIQEVVAGYGGAQAVAKLADNLDRLGSKWDYVISDPTTSSAYKTERYAFIWKTNNVKKIGDAWLEQKYNLEIDREPFYCTFESYNKQFTLVNFHAITKNKQPETEIKYFKFLPAQYPDLNLIFLGDFNCPQSHTVFFPLRKIGYESILHNQKTSLKQQCFNDNCLASEFDNMFYSTNRCHVEEATIIPFYEDFEDLATAHKISDHVPITATFFFN